jgi:hypothetical protein
MRHKMMEINYDKIYIFTPFLLANSAIARYNYTEHRAQSKEHRAKSTDYNYFLTSSRGKFFPFLFDFSVNKIRSESEGDVIAPANAPSAFADLMPP